uniref:Leucine zipper, putative tumor suppressor 2b n=1 Tax=Cyprinus carpio TaxID=7962 RepID=A0A8C2EGN8_CYPCA
MALVQSLPVSTDHPGPGLDPRLHPTSPPLMGAMGAVSSMMQSHVTYPDRANIEVSTKFRKGTPGSGRLLSETSQGSQTPSSKRRNVAGRATRSYSHEDLIRDGNDNHLFVGSTCADGPPRLVPVSGQLERQAIIRPTAFKPVVPRSRNGVQYLSPRLGAGLSGSQGNLSMCSPEDEDVSPVTTERRSSYSGARNALSSQSFTMTDTPRDSLTNLPAYNGPSHSQSEAGKHHGHSNSDSGRSSSSKSTGSLSGRGPLLTDPLSPPPIQTYEAIVRDLEDKLRERDLELRQLRENLDENEVAICQVYEERQERTELEMEEFRQTCAAKMQKASHKAQREHQLLQLQVFQLQQEKKKQQEDMTQLLQERQRLEERCASYEREHTQLGPRLEETKWEENLKQFLKQSWTASEQQNDRLKAELAYERQRASDQASAFESERKSWEEEKDKVIRYQTQLQQNYVQMYKRNRDLERSLRQLSLELESREQDDDSSGNEVTFDDIAATEI